MSIVIVWWLPGLTCQRVCGACGHSLAYPLSPSPGLVYCPSLPKRKKGHCPSLLKRPEWPQPPPLTFLLSQVFIKVRVWKHDTVIVSSCVKTAKRRAQHVSKGTQVLGHVVIYQPFYRKLLVFWCIWTSITNIRSIFSKKRFLNVYIINYIMACILYGS